MQVVVDDDRSFRCGATLDLSTAGALIEAEEPAEVGSRVRLIPLVETRVPMLELHAEVVRVDRRGSPVRYCMALALRLRPGEVDAIHEICLAGAA
jgi:hypothetical protein